MLKSFINSFAALGSTFRTSATSLLVILMLPPVPGLADVTAEITITDKSFPARPDNVHLAMYDSGDAGECVRATKVIGRVVIRVTAPVDKMMLLNKANEIEPDLLKVGAHAVMVTGYYIDKFTPNGYAETGSMVFSVLRFIDEPRVDRRSESDFVSIFKAKSKLAPIEGIWVDQTTKQRVAILEDPVQPGRYVGVQFDNGNETDVPKGLIVADFRLNSDGWLVGHFIFDDYSRFPTKLKMPIGDELKLRIKKCTNSYVTRVYPDKFPPEYTLVTVTYLRQAIK